MAFRILICLLLFAISTISKAGKFPFEFYSVHEGLPQASVFDMMQDSHGYLWIATDGGGVARFDGKDFFVLNKNNVLESKEITVTGEIPDLYVVTSGITAIDKIVLEGVQKVKDGEKIKYDYVSPKSVISNLRLRAE